VPSGEITSWFSGHGLLTYVDPATLTLKRFTPIGVPEWGEPILSTSRGAALAIGEQRGNRYVVAGFDLFPYQGRGTITQSVLFLNMVRWITAHEGVGAQSYRPYAAIEISSPQAEPTFVPELEWPSSSEDITIEDRYLMANHPGLIALKGSSDIQPLVPVNFIDARESSVSSVSESIAIEDRSLLTPNHTTNSQFELKRFLLPLLLALIALDWIGFPLLSSLRRRIFKRRSSVRV
jgi:hypothetical protein